MGRSSSSWETMSDHHVGLLSAAMLKWPLVFFMSELLLSQRLPEAGCRKGAGSTDRSRQWALPSIPYQWGEQQVPQGLGACVILLSGAPCEISQAEPFLYPLSPVQAEFFSAKEKPCFHIPCPGPDAERG